MWPADAGAFSCPTHFLREKPRGRGCLLYLIDTNNCGRGVNDYGIPRAWRDRPLWKFWEQGKGKIRKPSMVWYRYFQELPNMSLALKNLQNVQSRRFCPKESNSICFLTVTIRKPSTLYNLPLMKNSIPSTGREGQGVGGWY